MNIEFRGKSHGEPAGGGRRTMLRINGMTCSGCARQVTDGLQSVAGVAVADVQLQEAVAHVRWKPDAVPNRNALIDAVQKAGFRATFAEQGSEKTSRSNMAVLAGWNFNIVIGPILTLPMMVLEWGFGAGMERWYQWLAFALTLPVQVLCGARFYRGAWNQLKAGRSNMDTLVVLGSTSAFLYSTWGLFAGWHVHPFFMESASIITLISVGHWLEAKVGDRASRSLRALLNLAPERARLLGDDGSETDVPVAQLRAGQRIVLKPGDRVPSDGEVLEGGSAVDESMLTGESMPVDKSPGSKVFSGTISQNGRLVIKVTDTGETTALAQIIAVVRRAQNSRAKIQRLGDKVSSVFVPIVVLVAVATGCWWGFAPESARGLSDFFGQYLWRPHHPEGAMAAAIYHAVAVLIIACPCAMGLATPVAILAGTNIASERGILIRDGVALEKAGTITTLAFDKTGTLTEGKVTVAASFIVDSNNSRSPSPVALAAALARPSAHPLSVAVAGLSESMIQVRDWREVRGSGVECMVEVPAEWGQGEGQAAPAGVDETAAPSFSEPATLWMPVRLGSLRWLANSSAALSHCGEFIKEWSDRGATVLGLSVNGRLAAVFALQDRLKPGAMRVLETARTEHQRVCLITGDNHATARAIARQLGVSEQDVFAEVRPEAKAGVISKLQRQGEKVAFIGDGINDAPALEQADLGIAVSRASDVAREASDIILLKSDIQGVPEALGLAQATLRTIKQNLFWAFFYNAAGIPLAMLGFMSPILSALAMGLSDLIVIGNALRLRRWRPKRS